MNIEAIQSYVQGLLRAHPRLNARRVEPIIDDGTYPKIPGLEKTLTTKGLAIIVWRIGSFGLVDVAKTGVSNMLLHIPVVIQENVSINRGNNGTGITAEQALQYVFEAVSGNPKNTPPGTPIIPFHDAFENLGKVNGIYNIVANFTKQHRINPVAGVALQSPTFLQSDDDGKFYELRVHFGTLYVSDEAQVGPFDQAVAPNVTDGKGYALRCRLESGIRVAYPVDNGIVGDFPDLIIPKDEGGSENLKCRTELDGNGDPVITLFFATVAAQNQLFVKNDNGQFFELRCHFVDNENELYLADQPTAGTYADVLVPNVTDSKLYLLACRFDGGENVLYPVDGGRTGPLNDVLVPNDDGTVFKLLCRTELDADNNPVIVPFLDDNPI